MTDSELKTQIKIKYGREVDDALLSVYLSEARAECIRHEYQLLKETPQNVDVSKYDKVVSDAVVLELVKRGAEFEGTHSENGVSRTYGYTDMADYIASKIVPYAGVGR